jgi:hypothetical protein
MSNGHRMVRGSSCELYEIDEWARALDTLNAQRVAAVGGANGGFRPGPVIQPSRQEVERQHGREMAERLLYPTNGGSL